MGRVACVVFLFAGGVEFLDVARLVAGQHIGEYNVDPETLRDALRCALIVAGVRPCVGKRTEARALRAGPGCLNSAPRRLSGFLPGCAERGASRF